MKEGQIEWRKNERERGRDGIVSWCVDVAFYWGGGLCVKSIVLCVLPWKQGRLLYGRGVYSCRSVESVCVCVPACMMCVYMWRR